MILIISMIKVKIILTIQMHAQRKSNQIRVVIVKKDFFYQNIEDTIINSPNPLANSLYFY